MNLEKTSRKEYIEKLFMIIVAIIWLMLSAALPLVNKPGINVAGIPLLWFWVLVWVFIVPIVLSIAYYFIEIKR